LLPAFLCCLLPLNGAALLSGRITDENSRPVADVFIELYPTSHNTTSDQNGRFNFPRLAAGEYEIRCNHVAYSSKNTVVEIKSSSTQQVNIVLKASENLLPEITVSESYREVSREVITRKDIESTSAAGAEELIKDLGGLQVFRTDGTGSKVSIRGSSAKHVKVLLDGVAFNSAMDGSFDLAAIPAEIIERVEVYKQGSAELTGQGIGGVINIVTRKDAVLNERELNVKWTGTGFYSDRDDWSSNRFSNSEIAADQAFSLFNHNILLSGSYRDLGNRWSYINAGKYDQYRYINNPNTPFEMNNGYNRGNNFFSSVSSGYQDLSYSYFFNYSENNNGLPNLFNITPKTAFISDLTRKHRLDMQYKFRDKGYFNLNSFYDFGKKHILIDDLGAYAADNRDEYTNHGVKFKYLINLPWLAFRQGIDYSKEVLLARNLVGSEHSREAVSLFSGIERNDTLFLPWSSEFSSQGGIRREMLGGEKDQNNFYSAKMSWENKLSNFFIRQEAAYNENYNLPSFSDLFWMENVFASGNPDLKPETAISRSLGIAAGWNGFIKISASAEYFSRSVKNMIVWVKSSFNNKYMPKNNRGAFFSGWDLAASAAFFEEKLTLKSDYHYLYSENYTGVLATDGMPVIYKPKYSVNNSLSIKYKTWKLDANVSYYGKMYQLEESYDFYSDPYWLFNCEIKYNMMFNDNLEFIVLTRCDNLMDEQYQMVYGYPMSGRVIKIGMKLVLKY